MGEVGWARRRALDGKAATLLQRIPGTPMTLWHAHCGDRDIGAGSWASAVSSRPPALPPKEHDRVGACLMTVVDPEGKVVQTFRSPLRLGHSRRHERERPEQGLKFPAGSRKS
jgi:hypothetical protein